MTGAAVLASMTGFARTAVETPQGGLTWELKTVNAKGLDVRLRLPPGFDGDEAPFRARISDAIGRGTCHATLAVQRPPRPPRVRVDGALLGELIRAVEGAVPPGTSLARPTLDALLALPGVVEVSRPDDDPAEREVLSEAALRGLDDALTRLRSIRRDEGTALGALLLKQLKTIDVLTAAAVDAPGRAPEAVRDRLQRSVALLGGQVPPLDPNRLHQEALLLAARSDVQEELDRLRIHAASARRLLAVTGGAVGRRLDFLAQELAREANTLCAKSGDADLTATGLTLRNTVEQFREQVQNLE